MPTESGLVEPDILVNGRTLTFAESMAVRVAVGNFRLWLSDPENRVGLGARLADSYDRHLASVEQTMRKNQP